MKIYSGNVTHDASATATLYVRAASGRQAQEAILELARSGVGNFELNENSPSDYFYGDGGNDVNLVADHLDIENQEEWNSLEKTEPVYWPDESDQPYTKQQFLDFCHDNNEWAWKLYQTCHDLGGLLTPDAFISHAGFVESFLFDVNGNLMRLKRTLGQAEVVHLDEQPYCTWWDVDWTVTDPESQVVWFGWFDEEGRQHSTKFTFEGIANGRWEGNRFICPDFEGDETSMTFFKLSAIA